MSISTTLPPLSSRRHKYKNNPRPWDKFLSYRAGKCVARGKYNSKPTYGEISSSLVANDECVSLGDKIYVVMLLVET